MGLTYGSEYNFSGIEDASYTTICNLTDTVVVAAFKKVGGVDGQIVAGTISGSVITWNSTPYGFSSDAIYDIDIHRLDDSRFVITYNYYDRPRMKIGTVASGVITFGAEVYLLSGGCNYLESTLLDSTHVALTWAWSSGNKAQAVIAEISGDDITFGTMYDNFCAYSNRTSIAALDSTHFVISLTGSNTYGYRTYGSSFLGTVSGTTITFSSETIYKSDSIDYPSIEKFDINKFIITYKDINNSGYATAIVGSLSGTVFSYGSEYIFNSSDLGRYVRITNQTDTRVILNYSDSSNSDYGTSKVTNISGTILSFDAPIIFSSNDVDVGNSNSISTNTFTLSYRNTTDTFGYAVVGSFLSAQLFSFSGLNEASGTLSSIDKISTFRFNSLTELSGSLDSNNNILSSFTGLNEFSGYLDSNRRIPYSITGSTELSGNISDNKNILSSFLSSTELSSTIDEYQLYNYNFSGLNELSSTMNKYVLYNYNFNGLSELSGNLYSNRIVPTSFTGLNEISSTISKYNIYNYNFNGLTELSGTISEYNIYNYNFNGLTELSGNLDSNKIIPCSYEGSTELSGNLYSNRIVPTSFTGLNEISCFIDEYNIYNYNFYGSSELRGYFSDSSVSPWYGKVININSAILKSINSISAIEKEINNNSKLNTKISGDAKIIIQSNSSSKINPSTNKQSNIK